MFSWKIALRKALKGGLPAVPAFVVVRLMRRAGVDLTVDEAVQLTAFVSGALGFLLLGGRNAVKNAGKGAEE